MVRYIGQLQSSTSTPHGKRETESHKGQTIPEIETPKTLILGIDPLHLRTFKSMHACRLVLGLRRAAIFLRVVCLPLHMTAKLYYCYVGSLINFLTKLTPSTHEVFTIKLKLKVMIRL